MMGCLAAAEGGRVVVGGHVVRKEGGGAWDRGRYGVSVVECRGGFGEVVVAAGGGGPTSSILGLCVDGDGRIMVCLRGLSGVSDVFVV